MVRVIRNQLGIMLHYGGLKFEDFRYGFKEWPIKEVKDALPYGQLPIYEEDGRTLNQSLAIARYVASQVGLLPENKWEQAKLDANVLNIYDFFKRMGAASGEGDEEKKKALREEAIDFYVSRFEKELKAGNGHFGGKLSWADFILAGAVTCFYQALQISVDEGYPTVQALVSKIKSLPGVKEYIASRN